MNVSEQYVRLLTGEEGPVSPLLTDGYKFPMAQAGFPLRKETFYLHYRKGGPQYIPFDLSKVVEALRPCLPTTREHGFLLTHGYGMTPAMEAALQGELDIWAQPSKTWSNPHEPLVTITGPSFLVSWLEPLIIAYQFPLQVATAIQGGAKGFTACCQSEAQIIHLVAEALYTEVQVGQAERAYLAGVQRRVAKVKDALKGDIHRAFEVGMRGMTCIEQHRMVIQACKEGGIDRTSSVKMAYDHYMVPVGTTGHEHQMRHGIDQEGFRAIRDCRPEPPSYLFDTYDPVTLGIPAAVQVMGEDLSRRCSVRFDSGDQVDQLRRFLIAEEHSGIKPLYLFMDGYDANRVTEMEQAADNMGIHADRRHYGIGGYFGTDPNICPYNRNRIAMVYKLSQTNGRHVCKFSGSPEKGSLGGVPRMRFTDLGERWISQASEAPRVSGCSHTRPKEPSRFSPLTKAIMADCHHRDVGGSTLAHSPVVPPEGGSET